MQGRPSRSVIAAEWLTLACAIVAAALLAGDANWDPALFAILLVSAVASDLRAVRITANKIVVSGSFLVIITAIVLLGARAGRPDRGRHHARLLGLLALPRSTTC